jgi:ATP-binding cassette, subfamily C, bacterial
MSFKLLRYLIADAGVSKYFVVVTIAIFFAGIETLFLQQYFVIAPTIMSRDTLSVDTQATLYRGLIILAALYFGRFILALISSYTQISYIYGYAAYLTDRAARISLVRGIWSKQDDRAKIFISPELVATKCLKASLVIILELITVVALGVIIAIELQILLVIFIAIMCFFLTVVFYIPNIMLKKIGVLRDLADSEMQTRTASILEAPLDYVSADASKYALNLLSGSIGRKYSAIKKYNFISGVSRYTLEFSFLLSTFATALVAFLYMDLIILEIFIAMSGLIIGGLRIIPSAARMMQAFLDITFGLTALTGILPDRHFDCKNIASSDLANGSNIVGVTINSGKMLDFSEGLLRSISLEKGDLCLITGEIGAGKTLFLKLLSNRGGEDDLSLSINDCELYESDCDDPYYPIYVGATPFLIEGTLAENVYLCPASDISLSQVQRLEKLLLELLLGEADLVHSDNLLQANLSTGNRQIVGLLRAFLSNHPVLLLDEPTSALDPDLEVLVWQMIKRENRERCIFVVTHRAVPINLSAKRISVKKPGQITLLS